MKNNEEFDNILSNNKNITNENDEKEEDNNNNNNNNNNEEEDDDDDEDGIVLHASISKKPAAKYEVKGNKPYSNGSIISPSVEEEIYHKKLGNPLIKKTIRQSFVDEPEEEVFTVNSKNSKIIAPSVTNMDDAEIIKIPKQKPSKPEKTSKNKSGESLTTEAAIEFMIKQRQEMDREFAVLRAENDELKDKVQRQQHSSKPEKIVVEKVIEKKVIDPNSLIWKQDAEKLRKENEELRKLQAENEERIKNQKILAFEAQKHEIVKDKVKEREKEKEKEKERDTEIERDKNKLIRNQYQKHIEEKDDPDDASSINYNEVENNESDDSLPYSANIQRGKSEDNISRPVIKSNNNNKNVPKLDLSQTKQLSNRPESAPIGQIKSQKKDIKTNTKQPDYTGLPLILWEGGILWKIPYNGRGRPEKRLIMIKKSNKHGKYSKPVKIITNMETKQSQIVSIFYPPTIIWANPDKPDDIHSARELVLHEGAHVVEGYQSPAFWKSKTKGLELPPEALCFSIITNTRSLDLAAKSVQEAINWKTAIHTLLIIMSSNQDWAIDQLNRKDPVWYHHQLENPPDDYQRQKNESIPTSTSIGSLSTSRSKLKSRSNLKSESEPEYEYEQENYDNDDNYDNNNGIDKKSLDNYRRATKQASQQQLENLKEELFNAIRDGDYERIQCILRKKKISINIMTGNERDTPLMIACRLGMVDIVNLCLHYGAKNDPHPNFGQTALHCAVESRSILCVQAILNAALPTQSDSIITNLKDSKNQQTPLHFACSFGDIKIAKLLITHGSELSTKDKLSRTPLHICAYYGHKICLSYLLDSGGDSYLEIQDVYGNTALHYAAEQGHAACVKLLVETAANPIIRNYKRYTPYDLAHMKGHLPVCQILMSYNIEETPIGIHTSRIDPYIPIPLNTLERNVTYPIASDIYLPRPHTSRSLSGNSLISGSSIPMSPYSSNIFQQQQQQQQMQLNQLYLDAAMMKSSNQNLAYSGSLTARDKPNLFQGLQLNNPLTARRVIDDDVVSNNLRFQQLQGNMISNSSLQLPGSNVNSSYQQNDYNHHYDSNNNLNSARNYFDSNTGGNNNNNNNTTNYQEITYNNETNDNEINDTNTYNSLEQFYYGDTYWEVYQTEEGHTYYLDTVTQHSQWEDPRQSGIIYYDENTGEYVRKDNTNTNNNNNNNENQYQSKKSPGSSSKNLSKNMPPSSSSPLKFSSLSGSPPKTEEGDIEVIDISNQFSKPKKTSSKKRVDGEKKKKSKPQKIEVTNATSDDSDDVSIIDPRKNFENSKKPTVEVVDSSSDDGQYGRMYVRSGKYSKKYSKRRELNSDSGDSPMKQGNDDLDFSPVRVRNESLKSNKNDNSNSNSNSNVNSNFNSQGLSENNESNINITPRNKLNHRSNSNSNNLGMEEPDNDSILVDDYDNNGNNMKTNCFSPNKESLQRAAELQKTFSSVTSVTSPNYKIDQSLRKQVALNKEKKGKKSTKSSSLQINVFSDEDSPLNVSATMYSDADDDDDDDDDDNNDNNNYDSNDNNNNDDNEGSDWDNDNDNTKTSKPIKTGPLGNIEHDIKNQSELRSSTKLNNNNNSNNNNNNSSKSSKITNKNANTKSNKPTPQKQETKISQSEKPVKPEKLKKDKIFATEDGGYGNGGNILNQKSNDSAMTPLESPFNLDVMSSLKDGGFSPSPYNTELQLNKDQMLKQIEKYLDMLRQGSSLLTVKNSMAKAGESRELIKLMIEKADELHLTSNLEQIGSSIGDSIDDNRPKSLRTQALSPEELSALKQDPIIGKYVKMHAMGVPHTNIEQKMKMEMIDSNEITRFLIAIGKYQGDDNQSEVSPREGLRSSKTRKASVPLLKIHWSPLPAEKLTNSIFATARDDDSMHDEEFEEFEKLFGTQSKATENNEEQVKKEDNKKIKLYVLEPKRAQNIIIGLTQFKSIASHEIILKSICALSDLNGQLTPDRLQNISQLLPTIPECKKLPDAKDSQHPAEVFCNLANKYFPDLPKRLTCFITCLTFQDSCLLLTGKMKKVIDACNEIISSDNLARVLQKMLTVGNIMNEGTYRGQAAGFSLDSLLKMVHTKGVDKKTSVLDYVVKSLLDRGETSTLRVAEDLSFDDETCRISGKDTVREIDQLQNSITTVEEIYKNSQNSISLSLELIQECNPLFFERIRRFLDAAQIKMNEIIKMKDLMNRKIITVVEYFGEDEKTCETTKIFSVLKEFKVAFESSRTTLVARMERSKSRQMRSSDR